MARNADLTSIVHALGAEGVDFVLVGALAAVTQGAPVTTHDVDIVHCRLTYDDLLPLCIELQIDGRLLRVLGLDSIVRLKRASTHPKDRLVLPVLEQTLLRIRDALDK